MATSQGLNTASDRTRNKAVVDGSDWAAAAKSVAATAGVQAVPDGWYSMKQLSANVLRRSLSTTNRAVMAMLRADTAESRDFRVCINGRLKIVPHYKLKK